MALDAPEPLETPPPVTSELPAAAREQPSSPLESNPVPPAEDDAVAHWIGDVQDVSARVERLQAQGGLLPPSTRWAPETRALDMATIRHLMESVIKLEAVVGTEMCETADRNGHDDPDATRTSVLLPIDDEPQKHGNHKPVTVSSAEELVGDVADSDRPLLPWNGEEMPPREQVLTLQEEEKPYTQEPLAALNRPTLAADRKDSPARTRMRRSKRAVPNAQGPSAPERMTPDHTTSDSDAFRSDGDAETLAIPGLLHDEDAAEPAADAAPSISALAPTAYDNTASVDLTRCGWCGRTQFLTISKLGYILCECGSVYNPPSRSIYHPLRGCWSPGKEAKRQSPPAPLPATAA